MNDKKNQGLTKGIADSIMSYNQPDRRIAGSPDRRIAGSPDRRIAGSPDRRIAVWRPFQPASLPA